MKIAFATTNGVFVDIEFEKAKSFYVVDIKDDIINSFSRRKIKWHRKSASSYSRFEATYHLLKDCTVVCTKSIDIPARVRLSCLGIQVELHKGTITQALRKLKGTKLFSDEPI